MSATGRGRNLAGIIGVGREEETAGGSGDGTDSTAWGDSDGSRVRSWRDGRQSSGVLLRAGLRSRDEETADISVNSAMTGHLVLSTLHTNDAATTLPRLIEMKIEPYIVASTVNVITAQRLVRKICEKCRVSTEISMGDLQKKFPAAVLAKHFGKNLKKVRVYIGKGCPVCHKTGYAGRIGIYEVLVVSEDIKELIMAKADAGTIQKKAVAEGMNLLWEDVLEKVREGITTLDEVLRVTRD